MDRWFDFIEVPSEQTPHIGEHETEDRRTRRRVCNEDAFRHPRDAGRQGGDAADERNETAEKNREISVALVEAVEDGEFFRIELDVLAEPRHEGLAAGVSDRVEENAPADLAKRGNQSGDPHAREVTGRGERARCRYDQFRSHRNTEIPDRHDEEETEVTELVDDVQHEVRNRLHDLARYPARKIEVSEVSGENVGREPASLEDDGIEKIDGLDASVAQNGGLSARDDLTHARRDENAVP